jgi:hypothetical protein
MKPNSSRSRRLRRDPVLYYSTQFICRPELTGVPRIDRRELFFNAQVNG